MRVWIIYYQLNQPGGVNTWIENAIQGLRNLGHDVDLSYATLSGGMRVDAESHTRMGDKVRSEDRLPGDCIAYGNDNDIKCYTDRSGDYDVIMFAHPAPHDTKAYNDDNMMWLRLYSESAVPCVAVFHDDGWKRTNPWVVNIADHCEGILCAQHRFYEYLLSGDDAFPVSCSLVCWEYFPIALEKDIGLYDNEKVAPNRVGIMLSQWQGWKNHKCIIPQMCEVHTPRMMLYGGGIQYYYIRKTDEWKCAIGVDHVTGERLSYSPHDYIGYVPYSEIPNIIQQASVSIDASTRGRENMGMIEPMAYGCVSVVTEDVLNASPWQKLSEDVVVAASLDDLMLAAEDVSLNFESYRSEREAGLAYVREHHTIDAVASRLVSMFEAVLNGDWGMVGGLYEWV